MRKKFLIFLGIFIFMIIPKNVYADEVVPYYSAINNTVFSSASVSNNGIYSVAIDGSSSLTLGIQVQSIKNAIDIPDNSFYLYPYIFIYFQTWNTPEQMSFAKGSACSNSCFNQYSVTLKQIGTDAITGRYKYILILEAKKYWYEGGTTTTSPDVYGIDDSLTITNNYANSRGFFFYNVLLGNDTTIFNNNSIDINSIINNANTNTQSLINNMDFDANYITSNIVNSVNSMNTAIGSALSTQHQDLNNINNSLNNETAPTNNDVSGKATEWANKNASTQPISGMVLMPITLLNAYINGINATCSPYNLGSLYDTDLILPCINVSNYLGSTLWGVIDVLFSGFMIYAMGKKFVKIFNDFTNLRDNQIDELYGGGN